MSRHAREKNPEIRPSCELPLFEQDFYKFERTKSALSEAESAVSAGRTASPQRGHANRQPPREQTKSCLTAPLSANGESGDCRSLSDAQSLSSSPRDVARARRSDPATSKAAAASVKNQQRIRDLILLALNINGPMPDERIIVCVRNLAHPKRATEQGIRTRRSELVDEGKVEACDTCKTTSGRECQVWRIRK